jgi:molybdopterin molybdotransferase
MMGDPVALETVWRWIEANASRLDAEEVCLEKVPGRVPATAIRAGADVPATTGALVSGYAVRADETIGAAPYNPLSCPVIEASDGPLPRGAAARIECRWPLPAGADAVLASEFVEPETDDRVSILAPVAEGEGVEMAASELRAGDALWPVEGRGLPLRPAQIGLLSAAGILSVPVVRRPRTRILVPGTSGAVDILGPMLRALAERDGAAVVEVDRLDRRRAVAASLIVDADVLLIVGGDEVPPGARIGDPIPGGAEIAIRGVAIEPGHETCLARQERTLIALLPGLPAACFWSYELVAGRVVRCLGGRNPSPPYPTRRLRTTRKIVSALGFMEVIPVLFDSSNSGAVVPLPVGRSPRLRTIAQADGFTLVPAASEGYAAGSVVTVCLFEPYVRDPDRG